MNRRETLETAMSYVTEDREEQYGSPEDNFQLIADFWNIYLGEYIIQADDVAVMMSLLKIARIRTGKPNVDNYVDLAGYAACACEIATKIAPPYFDGEIEYLMANYEDCSKCEE